LPPALYGVIVLETGSHFLPRHAWDDRHTPPHPAFPTEMGSCKLVCASWPGTYYQAHVFSVEMEPCRLFFAQTGLEPQFSQFQPPEDDSAHRCGQLLVWMGVLWTICCDWPRNLHLLISAFQVFRIVQAWGTSTQLCF
jgi:hypothetical protein